MKIKCSSIVLITTLALLTTLVSAPAPAKAAGTGGPRAPGLKIFFYASTDAAFGAIVADPPEIDLYGGMLLKPQYDQAITDSDLTLSQFTTTFTITNHAFMSSDEDWVFAWLGERNPISEVHFRKAMEHLANRDAWIETILEGMGKRIDVPVAAPSVAWMNESIIGSNYPYPYSHALAKAELLAGGWEDYNNNGIINYPLDWPGKAGVIGVRDEPDMDALIYYAYNTPATRYAMALDHATQIQNIDWGGGVKKKIPVTLTAQSYDFFDTVVWTDYRYQIATDGWSVGRYPTYLRSFFGSGYWWPGEGGVNAYTPGYPELDAALDNMFFAPDLGTAITNAKLAQSIIMDKYALWIPIWSGAGFYAYRNLLGVVSTPNTGPFNYFTEMNAIRSDDATQPIRVGIVPAPMALNPITSMWVVDVTVMQEPWDGVINTNPYDVLIDQPNLARDWSVTTWSGGGVTGTLVKYWLDTRYNWIKPGAGPDAGTIIGPHDTSNQEFVAWYHFHTPSWVRASYRDIHHIRVIDNDEIEYYFNKIGVFYGANFYPWARVFYVPPGENKGGWKTYPLVQDGDPGTPVGPDGVTGLDPSQKTLISGTISNATHVATPPYGTGRVAATALPFRAAGAAVEILSVTAGGSLLTKYTDYEIESGYVTIHASVALGTPITIRYWARGSYAGDLPGGLPFEKTLMGTGIWYMTEYIPGSWAVYKPNRLHPRTTPPLGETNWLWKFTSSVKPRTGNMEITISDFVKGTTAYGSHANKVPRPNWNPSADLAKVVTGNAPNGIGEITVEDINTIGGPAYDTTFWELP